MLLLDWDHVRIPLVEPNEEVAEECLLKRSIFLLLLNHVDMLLDQVKLSLLESEPSQLVRFPSQLVCAALLGHLFEVNQVFVVRFKCIHECHEKLVVRDGLSPVCEPFCVRRFQFWNQIYEFFFARLLIIDRLEDVLGINRLIHE